MGIKVDHDVVIIGSGFGGICSAIKLKEAGIDNFVILEKDPVFGGTWRVNNYPGAACDIPSHLYSFSFAQNAGWSRLFPRQQELWEYTQRVVQQHGLMPHLRLGSALQAAHYDEAGGFWRIRTSRGEMTARTVISAMGFLGRPSTPKFPGLENFRGQAFHSAEWDHSVELRGKRVAVIGTGASAVQFIPEIQPLAAQLDSYQRTAHWVLPRPDRAVTGVEKWLLDKVKPLQLLYRAMHYVRYESRVIMFVFAPALTKLAQWQSLRHLKRQVPDPALREKLTPRYTLGCKRVLLTSNYYPALTQPNVSVQSDGIREVRAHSIVNGKGEERPVDVIIYATGFDTEHAFGPIDIRGRGGKSFLKVFEDGAGAYKGSTVAGFPNFFMITGPNTGLGHNSMIYMIESGTRYAVAAIARVLKENLHSVEVKEQVQRDYNQGLQGKLKDTVWSSGCKSWYLDSRGRNLLLWPGFTFHYRSLTKRFDIQNYIVQGNR
jgi:cation diffusion facilitator CzcD-associated flavoprotein CzcO